MSDAVSCRQENSADILFEEFNTIASAPGGVAKLRELILSLAVQGKLVPQNPADEPASVLLERIAAEKKRLVKKGEIKKAKPLPPVRGEEVPYEIPDSWRWTWIAHVTYNFGQKVPNADFTYIDVSSIDKDRGVISAEVNILKPEEAPSRARKIVSKDTVIYSTVRPYLLNIVIIEQNYNPNPIASTAFAVLHPHCGVSNRFLYYYLRSPQFTKFVVSEMAGMAYPAISESKFFKGLIPLPPLPEQHRIVEKVDALMKLCDALEAQQAQQQEVRTKLGTATLAALSEAEDAAVFDTAWGRICDEFDLIFDTPENVAALRQAVLQLAVQGKLVPQDPADEPASVLLERIATEKKRLVKEGKIKKAKPLLPVREDEVPYDAPVGWMWTRYDEITTVMSNLVDPKYYLDLPHIAPNNIEKGTAKLLDYCSVREDGVESPNHHFYPNHIIYSKIRPNLSKLVIADFEGLCSADMYPIKSHIDLRYLKYYMLSIFFYKQVVSDENRLAMPKINQEQLKNVITCIPPLAEQHRIVEKVDALMVLCDDLETQIRKRREVQTSLLESVITGLTAQG